MRFSYTGGKWMFALLCVFLPFTAHAQLDYHSSHEISLWTYSSTTRWTASRPGVNPALSTVYQNSGITQEYDFHYWVPTVQLFFDFKFGKGRSDGTRQSDEFCMGAYVAASCGTPSPLFSSGQSYAQGAVTIFRADMRQRLVSFKKDNSLDVTSPPLFNYDWFIGYFRLVQKQDSYGITYQTGGGGNISVQTPVMNSVTRWDAGRLGGGIEYFPKGKRGGWRMKGELAYLFTSLSGDISDYLQGTNLGGNVPNIKISGTGTGLMSEIAVRYRIDDSKQMGVGYRYWKLNASGTQQLGPIFVARIDLSSFEIIHHGPAIFFNIAF